MVMHPRMTGTVSFEWIASEPLVKIKLVGSSVGQGRQHQYLMSYVVNHTIAIDAGCIGLITPLEEQKKIKHVFISHAHIDHVASLPSFIDNVYQPGPDCVRVYCEPEVQQCLKQHLFNDQMWPDVVKLSQSESPFLEFCNLRADRAVEVDGVVVTPVRLYHVVPTLGFLIEGEHGTAAIISDTLPTDAIWELLATKDHVGPIFLEASFPNRMQWLADKSRHLTPQTFAREVAKAPPSARIVVVHIKPEFHDEILSELRDLKIRNLEIGAPNAIYTVDRH